MRCGVGGGAWSPGRRDRTGRRLFLLGRDRGSSRSQPRARCRLHQPGTCELLASFFSTSVEALSLDVNQRKQLELHLPWTASCFIYRGPLLGFVGGRAGWRVRLASTSRHVRDVSAYEIPGYLRSTVLGRIGGKNREWIFVLAREVIFLPAFWDIVTSSLSDRLVSF